MHIPILTPEHAYSYPGDRFWFNENSWSTVFGTLKSNFHFFPKIPETIYDYECAHEYNYECTDLYDYECTHARDCACANLYDYECVADFLDFPVFFFLDIIFSEFPGTPEFLKGFLV